MSAAPEPANLGDAESAQDEITFALAPEGGTLAKRVFAGAVISPPHLLRYVYLSLQVSSLRELLRALEEGAELGAFALRGQPFASAGRRAIKDDPAKGPAGLAVVPRRWAALDWDSLQAPGVDPLDGEACCRAILHLLPPELRNVSMIWQLTASAGIKVGIRLRSWHWLDRPLSTAEAKHWLSPLHKGPEPVLDPSTLEPCQPIYLAVLGGPQIRRWGILTGSEGETAAPPFLELPARPGNAPRSTVRRSMASPARRVRQRRTGTLRRAGTPRMRKLIHACIRQIDAARGQEGQRLAAFKHWAARALALAEIAGIHRSQVEDMLLRAGARLYDGDAGRYAHNIEPLIDWWRQQQG